MGERRYRTIVADPPWECDSYPTQSTSVKPGKHHPRIQRGLLRRRTAAPYPTMTVPAIAALPVEDMAAQDAHLYLWTTSRHLRSAFTIVEAWRFEYSATLVWAKTPMGEGFGGTFSPTVEFVLFARRGSPTHKRTVDTRWWNWPRMGNAHSRKPEAFLDMVESVSPGPYLELFARRQRLGWDTWGNEALNHVELAS